MAKGRYREWLTEEGMLRLKGWAMDGLTDAQIAHNIGINVGTLYEWKNKYPNIAEVLKKSKEVADRHVENALYKRAVGYKYEEVKVEKEHGLETKRTVTIKEVAPDTTAQIFWLKNRKRLEWRDKQELEHSGEIKMPSVTITKKEANNE